MTSSNNLNTLWKIPLVPLLFMCVRSHVHCFLYTTDHNVLDLLILLLSLEMSRHSHGSWATNIITSTIHWELKRRHPINSGNSQKTPANALLSVMMLTLLLLSLFYKWKNKLYSKIPLLVSDSSTYYSSTACARCPCWAIPLLFKGGGVFCGVNVPSFIPQFDGHFDGLQYFAMKSLDMPLVNFMSSSPFSADTSSSRVSESGTLLCPLPRLSDFVVAWGCLLPPFPWQYQVYPWWFQLQFFIIRRLNKFSFLMTSWFSSFVWSVFAIACFLN